METQREQRKGWLQNKTDFGIGIVIGIGSFRKQTGLLKSLGNNEAHEGA